MEQILTNLLAALKVMGPAIEPIALQEFDTVVVAELQKLENGIGSPDLKLMADGLIKILQTIGDKEIAAKL